MSTAAGVELVPVGPGAVGVTHRPRLASLPGLRTSSVTHLVTLLSAREGAEGLGGAAVAAGLRWVWLPVPDGREPTPATRATIVAGLVELAGLVRGGAHLVIHCSAGIHRTGMITYALLRTLGLAPDEAGAALARMRSVTAGGLGDHRLAWAEQLAELATERHAVGAPGGPAADRAAVDDLQMGAQAMVTSPDGGQPGPATGQPGPATTQWPAEGSWMS
ncbi:protein-tyrosine phosphatase family protein [Pseudofrankia inefficax]|uniref:protein-tyrosine phosphatase family protein n=1 Tax=Pseudofrankia inefficax (strain DSM 45817 / CECT 9037 / DDB 130130 / EuI1c) TaxID=298654 RepID=UPI0003240403|nr:tyrosine-protein phosphatase [Pseudofrankia inefficax]